jgi:hypothetical protein
MSTVAEGVYQNHKNTKEQLVTTTLNVVFNGTMVMGFGPEKVTVIVPFIEPPPHDPRQPDHPEHRYEINHKKFEGKPVSISMSPSHAAPPNWKDIFEPGLVMKLDAGPAQPMPERRSGKSDAIITLPYPDHIQPLRFLDMEFTPRLEQKRFAGALVFSYDNVLANSIVISLPGCVPRSTVGNFSELYVFASIPPGDDLGDEHSKRSWRAVNEIIHSNLDWAQGKEDNPQAKRVAGMDMDVDDKERVESVAAQLVEDEVHLHGGGNCKVPIAIVTYKR